MSPTPDEAGQGEIVPIAAPEMELVAPAAAEKVLAAFKAFQWLKTSLLGEDDYQPIGETRYIKKSGWMKIALACNLNLEKREERVERDGGEVVYHYTYRAIAPSGRFADADGSASTGERDYSHVPHDVRALAQTRACNRAVSNLVGGGEASAEELVGPGQGDDEPSVPFIDQAGVLDALERAGLDTTVLAIYPDDGRYVVKPLKFLGDVFGPYNDALAPMGFRWVRAGKESRWEVQLAAEA